MKSKQKQPSSISLSKDVRQILTDATKLSGLSKSSIVETAILFWHAQKWEEWKQAFAQLR